jgi:hypothetical protein
MSNEKRAQIEGQIEKLEKSLAYVEKQRVSRGVWLGGGCQFDGRVLSACMQQPVVCSDCGARLLACMCAGPICMRVYTCPSITPAPDPVQDLAEQAARSQNSSDEMTNTTSLTSLTSHSAGLTVSAAASAAAAPTAAADAGGSSGWWATGQAARNLQEGFAAQAASDGGAATPYFTPPHRSRTGGAGDAAEEEGAQ